MLIIMGRKRAIAKQRHKDALIDGFDLEVDFESNHIDVDVEFDEKSGKEDDSRKSKVRASAYMESSKSKKVGRKSGAHTVIGRAYTVEEPISNGWIKKESDTQPGKYFYFNEVTHETRLEAPHEGPRKQVRPSRLSKGPGGMHKHLSNQISRIRRASARRKTGDRGNYDDPNTRHGTYDHWKEDIRAEGRQASSDINEVVMSEIFGQHLRGEATDEKEIVIDEGDYFDHIDSILDKHFSQENPMVEKAMDRPDNKDLPPGWAMFYHEESGSHYYHNENTNETSWDHPDSDNLPPGWVRVIHDASGKHYYHNEVTDETCWVHPGKHEDPETHFVNPKTGARFDVGHL